MSGIQFNSPVSNQKSSPAIYASSLATRPAPKLPGRIFVDTDNPSTGMYRDTGTAWVQISSGSGGSQNLQQVTDVGNSTTNDITLLYSDSGDGQELSFYNQDVDDATYKIEKPAGPESLRIMALKPSGANEEFGLLWEGGDNVLKTIYNDQQLGLFLDFANPYYILGSFNDVIEYNNYILFSRYDGNSGNMFLQNTGLVDNDPAQTFNHYITSNWDEQLFIFSGILSDSQNTSGFIQVGGSGYISLQAQDLISSSNGNFYTDANQAYFKVYDGSFDGSAKITNNSGTRTFEVSFGFNSSSFGLDATNTTLTASNNLTSNSAGGNSGKHLKIKINGVQYKITLNNN
jgi:hypothetical protein